MTDSLRERQCQREVSLLDAATAEHWLGRIDAHWSLTGDARGIRRDFKFKNYYHTMAFVNALAWIAHQQDHHPDLFVAYNRCSVTFSTHSVGGLSENDFICAAHVDSLDAGQD